MGLLIFRHETLNVTFFAVYFCVPVGILECSSRMQELGDSLTFLRLVLKL